MYTVLIVDDDRKTREGLARFIEWQSFGFEYVLLAKDGKEAYDLYLENSLDLIISDIKMPKMDGIDLLKHIRKKDDELPFIFLTAYTEVDFLKNAVRYGAYDYINKPVRLKELKEVVSKAKEDIINLEKKKNEKLKMQKEVVRQKQAIQEERLQRLMSHRSILETNSDQVINTEYVYLCVFSLLGNTTAFEIQTFLENKLKNDFIHVEKDTYHILIVEIDEPLQINTLTKIHQQIEKELASTIFVGCSLIDQTVLDFNIALKQTKNLFYESFHTHNRFNFHDKQQNYGLAQEIKNEIYQELSNTELTIQGLAEKCGVSVQHLIRIYKEEYGITPNQALMKVRIDKAKAMLLYTNYRIQEIAYLCGFKDPNYFGKAFKKAAGVTPKAFREQYYV